jgi:hypothetical protein
VAFKFLASFICSAYEALVVPTVLRVLCGSLDKGLVTSTNETSEE